MPLVELSATKRALSEDAIPPLAEAITRIVLKAQGARPDSAAARSISRVIVREVEPDRVFQGGEPPEQALYRLIVTTPQGALNDASKATLVAELTHAVLAAEGTAVRESDAQRVWCVINEIPDGNWGSGGQIYRWRDIQKWVVRKDFTAKRQTRAALKQASASAAEGSTVEEKNEA